MFFLLLFPSPERRVFSFQRHKHKSKSIKRKCRSPPPPVSLFLPSHLRTPCSLSVMTLSASGSSDGRSIELISDLVSKTLAAALNSTWRPYANPNTPTQTQPQPHLHSTQRPSANKTDMAYLCCLQISAGMSLKLHAACYTSKRVSICFRHKSVHLSDLLKQTHTQTHTRLHKSHIHRRRVYAGDRQA